MGIKDLYRFEDYIMDESFREFVEGTKKESVDYWSQWLSEHPDKTKEIQQASEVLLTLINHKKQEVKIDKHNALHNLLRNIDQLNIRNNPNRYFAMAARIAAIIVLAIGLSYTWQIFQCNKNSANQHFAYNEIIVPVGEKSQVILPDGTHVWINSGSKIKYEIGFGQDTREVIMEGEAYFDVTKNSKTFTVNTHDARIKVMGTAFNVKSYPEDKKTQTTVVRGLVRVESKEKGIKPVLIGPEQMAVIREAENSAPVVRSLSVLNKVNTSVITSWKDQFLVFADETFEDLAIKMERWYNTEIIIEDQALKKERYTGKFVNNETIYQVLEAIKVTTPIEYISGKDAIIITRKQP